MLLQHCSREPGSPFQMQLQQPPGRTAAGMQNLAGSLPAKGPHRTSMHLMVLQMLLPANYLLCSQQRAAGQLKAM